MNKVLITGASSGIGFATAQQLISQGCAVTGLARDFAKTEEIGMQTLELDLAQLDKLASRLKTDPLLNQNFDCLVLNAGYGSFGGLEQFSHAQIRHLLDTNLVSNLYLLKHYLPEFKNRGGIDIVIIGSESALNGAKQGAVYCASKFAIRGLAQSLRADCAGSDIRVMLVNPGPVDSDFFDDLNFTPKPGEEFVISSQNIADAISSGLQQPRNVVIDEINIQPIKRSFQKKVGS